MKFNSSWQGVPKHYEVCQLLSVLLLLAVPKMLPDGISLLLFSLTSGGIKKKAGKKCVYNPADLRAALRAIQQGINKKSGHENYDTPRSTLQFQLNNKFLLSSMGLPPVLSKDEEQALVRWTTDCS